MVVPDLYVFTLKFHSNFSLYKKDKNMKIRIFQKKNIFLDYSHGNLFFMDKKVDLDAFIFCHPNF